MTWLGKTAMVLAAIGAINWGLVALKSFKGVSYQWDLVNLLTGNIPILAATIYLLIGLSGIWLLIRAFE